MSSDSGKAGRPVFSRPFKVEDVRESAVDVDVVAEPAECAALAAQIGVPALHALSSRFHIAPGRQGRLEVRGRIKARLTQVCVVTLDEFDSELEEAIEVTYAPEAQAVESAARRAGRPEAEVEMEGDEPPDPIIDGRIDLGVLTTEFLVLGLDPYPRKPGVAFEAEAARTPETQDESPFAALARLKGREQG